MPFLENVTRGRGIPRERLGVGGRALLPLRRGFPINGINRALIDQIRAELAAGGEDLPVYFGNRNSAPFVEDTVAQMRPMGHPGRGVQHLCVGRLLRLRAVPGGHHPGRGPSERGAPGAGQTPAVLRPSAAGRDVRRRRGLRRRQPCPSRCAGRPGWSSPRTRSRCARRTVAGQIFTSVKSGTRPAWLPRPPATPITTWWAIPVGPPQVPWLEPDVGITSRCWPSPERPR